MSRVSLSLLLALILFGGCSLQPMPGDSTVKDEPLYIDENTLILFAMDAQTRGNRAEAVGYYDLLYEKTENTLYRDQAITILMEGHYYDDVVSRLLSIRSEGETLSQENQRNLAVAFLAKNELEKAKKEALELTEADPSEENYLLLAEVYRLEKDYDKVLESLEKGYQLNYSEKILDKIALLMYTDLNRRNEAIERLEQHIKNFGYSLLLAKRLVAFYGDQRNEEGLLEVFPHLYDLEPTEYNAGVLIQLYWNAKQMQELTQFLERSGSNDPLLLKIYMGEKRYIKAIPLAQKLYDETGDIDYFAQKAILEYEVSEDRYDSKTLEKVIDALEKVVAVKEDGYYLNYLGYCMIERGVDVKRGIDYVEKALAIEPDSGYFIDSLAWGYYKQGRCDEAYKLMQRVVELLGSDDEEVRTHLEAIRKCKKGKK